MSTTEKIPKFMAEKFSAITAHTDAFCEKHLDDEYRVVIHRVIGTLASKRPSPLLRGEENVRRMSGPLPPSTLLGESIFLMILLNRRTVSRKLFTNSLGLQRAPGSANPRKSGKY